MQLMPAVAMLAVTVLVRGNMSKGSSNGSFIILSVCTMGVGILTTILGIISSRKEYKEDSQTRVEKYNTYSVPLYIIWRLKDYLKVLL